MQAVLDRLRQVLSPEAYKILVDNLRYSEVVDFIKRLEGAKWDVYETWNLKRYVPYICVQGRVVIVDLDALEVYVADEHFISFSEDYEQDNLETLDGEVLYELHDIYYDELITYGNAFSLILPLSTSYVKVRGRFLDSTVYYKLPYEDVSDEEWEELTEWLDKHRQELWDIFKTYTWRPTDAYRGHYEGAGRAGRWVKVIEGWIGLGTADEDVERLAKLERLEEDYGIDFPVLFTFPRSSNVCVTYFDVYVPEQHVDTFFEKLGIDRMLDKFDFSRGIYVRAVAD